MRNEEIEKFQKALVSSFDRLSGQANIISMLGLANEFYTKDERTKLYVEFDGLVKADEEARTAYNLALPSDGLSWEQRVASLGEQKARSQLEPSETLYKVLQERMRELQDFKSRHAILVELLRLKHRKIDNRLGQ